MNIEFEFIAIIYLLGVFILILPRFLNENSNLVIILKNLSIWVLIILIVFSIIYFFDLF